MPHAPQIFISRALKVDSRFRIRLEAMGAKVMGQSLIEFTPVAFEAVPSCEWIFFYSKKAVRFFFEGLTNNVTDGVAWATFGRGTAAELSEKGITPDFIGTGPPEGVAEAFAKEAAGETVLFPQARQSRQSIQQLLEDDIQAISLVVYDNQPRSDFELPYNDILTFTSPLNAAAYFGKYGLREEQVVVAIGDTTATALRQLGVTEVKVAEEPSEEGLTKVVETWLEREWNTD